MVSVHLYHICKFHLFKLLNCVSSVKQRIVSSKIEVKCSIGVVGVFPPSIPTMSTVAAREPLAPLTTELPPAAEATPTPGNAESTPISPGGSQRTIDNVRELVAVGVAIRAVKSSETVDGIKVGVALTMPKNDNEQFLRHVVSKIKQSLLLQQYLFVVAPSVPHNSKTDSWPMLIFGSTRSLVVKATTLACAKFLGRVKEMYTEKDRWLGIIEGSDTPEQDEAILWDIVRKASRTLDPLIPPMGALSIDEILARARSRLERITPQQAYTELHDPNFPAPVVLVDIRPFQQRAEHGEIPEALVIERNVLEWRFDPRSKSRIPIADRYDLRVIIFCQEGYTSSLAAASLHDLGLLNATDIIGGYRQWQEEGYSVDHQLSDRQTLSMESLSMREAS